MRLHEAAGDGKFTIIGSCESERTDWIWVSLMQNIFNICSSGMPS